MPVTTGFTPSEAVGDARERHIAFTTDVLADAELYEVFDRLLLAEILEVSKGNPEALVRPAAATVAVATGDGGTIDLATAYLAIESLDATRRGRLIDVQLIPYALRLDASVEQQDEGRPVGTLQMDGVNNRWLLQQLVGWLGVSAIRVHGIPVPGTTTAGNFATDILFPRELLHPVVEQLALHFGHTADLNADWMRDQVAKHKAARATALTRLAVR